ncbi:MAG TPA: class II aldolase/adducin family protein [Hyphomicrobiales bacterium]|nr:class II aldolase/adducin family protein [Hyphomicrobiales bacterium]
MVSVEHLSNIDDTLKASLDELAQACRVLEMEGHSDMTLGHMSLRDPGGRGLWLKRSGISLGEVQSHDDFTLIDFDGNKLAGVGRVHKEWPIHTKIMQARPDVNAVGHTHPLHACAFSATDEELKAVTHEATYLGGPPARYDGTTGLIDTPKLGRDLAESLGDASTVLMRNHGISFVGPTIPIAAMMGIFIEKACRAQLLLMAAGVPYTATPANELAAKRAQVFDGPLVESHWNYFLRRLDAKS